MAGKKKVDDAEVSADAVTVEWKGRSRVYSLAVHGENFKELAEEFAKKCDGKVV